MYLENVMFYINRKEKKTDKETKKTKENNEKIK